MECDEWSSIMTQKVSKPLEWRNIAIIAFKITGKLTVWSTACSIEHQKLKPRTYNTQELSYRWSPGPHMFMVYSY